MVLRNISNAAVTVSGRIPYTLSNGTQATATIQSFQLASGDVKKVNLPSIASSDQITSAGLEFNYTGNIGSVIGSALSYSNDRNQVFRVPLRDAQVQSSSTGTYPWSINGNSSTMVYLKNVTDSPKQFVLAVRFAGGNYVLNEQTIPAWQSVVFDLRTLRDNQTPDGNGNVIPLNITNGQAHWSARGTTSKPMIGRAEQPDISNGMSMTSACGILCSDSFLWAWMTPASISGFIDDTTQFSVFRQMVDGFGNQYTQQYAPNNWSCDNPSVATVNQNGFATAVGVGSSYIRNPFTAFTYTDEGSYCSENSFTAEPTAICTVLPLDFTITTNHTSIKPTGIESGLAGADPAIPAADTQAAITVTTNPPVAGRTVQFSIVIDSTDTETLGGHLGHTGTRTLGTFSSVTGVTNQAGEVTTTYTAPIFGGIHKDFGKIKYLNPGSDVSKSVSVTVKIPGLQFLNPDSGNYTLTGTTNWHPFNHWGTAIAVTNLPLIANDYKAMYPTATNLLYNDMSLRYGGKFDVRSEREIPTSWTNASHDEHRVGRNCDVTSGVVPTSRWQALNLIFLSRNVQNVHDETRTRNHWHLRFSTQ